MAKTETKTTEAAEQPAPSPAVAESAEAPASSTELVDQIGTLTYPRAVQNFGEANALAAMREVARIGGHGEFDDTHFMSPMFGGLGMPDPTKVAEPRMEDFASHPEGEFYFQKAVEDWEKLKQRAIENRQAINSYYASLK